MRFFIIFFTNYWKTVTLQHLFNIAIPFKLDHARLISDSSNRGIIKLKTHIKFPIETPKTHNLPIFPIFSDTIIPHFPHDTPSILHAIFLLRS